MGVLLKKSRRYKAFLVPEDRVVRAGSMIVGVRVASGARAPASNTAWRLRSTHVRRVEGLLPSKSSTVGVVTAAKSIRPSYV